MIIDCVHRYDIVYGQRLDASDVYLGLSGRSGGGGVHHCDGSIPHI